MNNDNNSSASDAVIKKSSKVSAVWSLPILAALIGIWLVFKAFSEAGVDITMQFNSANGILPGKTEVRYKGLTVGLVKAVDLNPDLQTVTATVEMISNTKPHLNDNTLFWLVSPEISLSEISGLDTVITGNYIMMRPGDGKPKSHFVALEKAAPPPANEPGLHLTLFADTLSSVSVGSSIYYKQLAVGSVIDYDLTADGNRIEIKVLIEPEHMDLVKPSSRFWNASGITVSGNLSGFKLQTQSLGSIIAGGIAFYNPDEDDEQQADNHSNFLLYKDFDEAKSWLSVTMHFPELSPISPGETKVMFESQEIGFVEEMKYNKEQDGGWVTKVMFDPRVKAYLTEDAQFWLETPSVSFSKMDSFKTILSGAYIGFKIGDESKPAKREFIVSKRRPVKDYTQNGLHLQLTTKRLGAITEGAKVYYRRLKVGEIQGYRLEEDGKHFDVHIFIEPEYAHLINEETVFFENAGVEITGNLRSFSLQTRPLEAMLAGGISFFSKTISSSQTLTNGYRFKLFKSREESRFTEQLKVKVSDDSNLSVDHTALIYLGETIGKLTDLEVNTQSSGLIATFDYNRKFRELMRDDTALWMVTTQISAAQIQGLDALIKGPYVLLRPGRGELTDTLKMLHSAPPALATDDGLQLRFSYKDSGSVVVGAPITHLKMQIGQIETLDMSEDGKHIDISATIEERYRHLVSDKSRFYVASGVTIEGSVTNLSVRTESMATVLRGGIALYNNGHDSTQPAAELSHFDLYDSLLEAQIDGKPVEINFDRVVSLKPGADVRYSGHVVGKVKQVSINSALTQTQVTLSVSGDYPGLVSQSAQYWLGTGQIGLAEFKNPDAIIGGNFIGVLPGDGGERHQFDGMLTKPPVRTLTSGLNIRFSSSRLGSVKSGDPIYFRQIEVGEVLGYELSDDANQVIIFANISSAYQHLVSTDSKFWHASGINVDAGVFSGVQIQTESLETILSGGIAFATPPNAPALNQDVSYEFPLYDEVRNEWLGWKHTQ